MKKVRVITAVLLIITLLSAAVTGFAEKNENADYSSAEENLAERFLSLGIIKENYADLDSKVTRADMAKIIVDFANISDMKPNGGISAFSDVESGVGGADEINLLYNMGYISGTGDKLFHPLRQVTIDEAIVFIINAIGYKTMAEVKGGYPNGYRKIASSYRLYDGVRTAANEPITLLNVYKLLDNSLDMPAMVLNSLGQDGEGYSLDKDHTVMNEIHNIYKKEGIVTGNADTTLTSHDTSLKEGSIEVDGIAYESDYDYSDYIGSYVTCYFKENNSGNSDTVVYMERKSSRNNQLVLEAKDIEKDDITAQRVYYRNEAFDLKHIDVSTNVSVIMNGKCYLGYGTLQSLIPDYGIVKFIDNNNDSRAEVIVITSYENIVVKTIDATKGEIENRQDGSVFKIDTDRDDMTVINESNGMKAELSDIKIWDVLTVSVSKNSTGKRKIVIHIVRDTVKGKVEGTGEDNGERYVLINQNQYKFAPGFSETLKSGNRGIFYLDYRGNIAAFRSGEDEGRSYGVFFASREKSKLEKSIQYKLFDEYGEWGVYDLKEKVVIDGKKYNTQDDKDNAYVANTIKQGELIRFTLTNDKKISAVDTIREDIPYSQGTLNLICSDKTLYYRDGIFFSPDDGFQFAIGSDTVMFAVPEDLNDENAYSTSVGKFETQKQYTWSYKAYTIGEGNIDVATAMLFKGVGGSGAVEDYTPFSVVKEFKWGADKDGDMRAKIVFANKDADKSGIFVADEVTDSATSTVQSLDDFKLQPNDIIQYAVNDYGMINEIFIIYRYDTKGGTLTPGELDPNGGTVDTRFNSERTSIDANGRHVYATVSTVENDLLKFYTKESVNPQLANLRSTTNVYRVSANNDRGLPVITSVDSIKENDTIVLRLQVLTAKEIFIIE